MVTVNVCEGTFCRYLNVRFSAMHREDYSLRKFNSPLSSVSINVISVPLMMLPNTFLISFMALLIILKSGVSNSISKVQAVIYEGTPPWPYPSIHDFGVCAQIHYFLARQLDDE